MHMLVTRVAQLYQINHLGVILKSPFLNWTVHEDGEWRSTAWSGTQGIFAGLVDQMRVLKYFGYTVILCVVVSVLFVLYAPVFGGSQSPESLERIKHSRNFVEDKFVNQRFSRIFIVLLEYPIQYGRFCIRRPSTHGCHQLIDKLIFNEVSWMFDSLQTFWRLAATKYWGIEHKQHTNDNTENYCVTKIFQDPHLIN